MNKLTKILAAVLIAATILLGSTLGILYFGLGIDIFDRSGWDTNSSGETIYLDYHGDPVSDWQLIDGSWYYFDQTSHAMATGWLEQQGKRYYLDETGVRLTGWVELADGSYYISPSNGAAATGWLDLEEGRYFLDEATGRMHTGWLDWGGERYHLGSDGLMTMGWLETPDGRYFLSDTGTMLTGWITTSEGTCYLNETTGAVTTGWLELEDQRYYLKADGYLATGWTDTEEGRCYFNELGQPHTGWLDLEDRRYLLDETGLLTLGWYESGEGVLYYFREDGSMAVGQLEIDGINRFFTSTGAHVVLVNKWNPVPEDYKPDLVSYGKWEVDRSCYEALRSMLSDLKSVGYYEITSAYRSTSTQKAIWNNRIQRYMNQGYSKAGAEEKTALEVAVPGTSEHHLGLAVDISAGDKVDAWLAENSWRYGFILRYPEGKTELTGIIYEPWHYRYVGLELAQELYELDLCMEEYMAMLTPDLEPADDTAPTDSTDPSAPTEDSTDPSAPTEDTTEPTE